MNSSRGTRLLAPVTVVAAVALLVSACGSDKPAAKPPNKAALQKVVVQQSDLPSGYTGKAATADSSDDDLDAQLQKCTGVTGIKSSDQLMQVKSDDFTKGQISISSDASSYKNKSAIDKRVDVLKSPKINDCLNSAFKEGLNKQLPTGTTLSGVDVTLTQGSSGGPKNVVATAGGSVTVTAGGQTAKVYLGVAFITGTLLTSSVSFTGLGAPLDASTQKSVLAAVAKRADAA